MTSLEKFGRIARVIFMFMCVASGRKTGRRTYGPRCILWHTEIADHRSTRKHLFVSARNSIPICSVFVEHCVGEMRAPKS
jgi:hypothetical protein